MDTGDFVVISNCAQADIFRISAIDNKQNTLRLASCKSCTRRYPSGAFIQKLKQVRFFVSRGAGGQPALFSAENNHSAVELIEGVEKIRFYYGHDVNNDGAADHYVRPEVITDSCIKSTNLDCWNDISSIRYAVLMRSVDDKITQKPQAYQFDGKQHTASDRRLRRELIKTVPLLNHRYTRKN